MLGKYIIFFMVMISCSLAKAQYISELIEYVPAPGQFINTTPWGFPGTASSIVGGVNGTMSLGGFGGYVIFRFDGPVENHPDNPFGVDFTLFGNPFIDWSEPGIVSVMEDENNNELPDDTWYELAGSDFHFSSTVRNYEITYFNPGDTVARDVPWVDNRGNSGSILANKLHTQSYFPLLDSFPGIPADEYTLSGTLIRTITDTSRIGKAKSIQRAFGYADNKFRGVAPYTKPDNPYTPETEHSGGDGFDIHWAVDRRGEHVDLERIHFIKVQSAAIGHGGFLGELSTEITGAVDVGPDPVISGTLEMIVVKDLPPEIHSSEYQLEPFVFYMGRVQNGEDILWTTSMDEAVVDEDHLLSVTRSGELILTASLVDNPEIAATVFTTVNLEHTGETAYQTGDLAPLMYPNPAKEVFWITGIFSSGDPSLEVKISIYDTAGKLCTKVFSHKGNNPVDISGLQTGLYMVKIDQKPKPVWLKLLKD